MLRELLGLCRGLLLLDILFLLRLLGLLLLLVSGLRPSSGCGRGGRRVVAWRLEARVVFRFFVEDCVS